MANTIIPSEEEKRELYNLSNNIPFDDRINHEASLSDLNITLIQSYLKEVNSSLFDSAQKMDFIDLCKNMNIINSLPEYTKPKNVGLMFFCLNPEHFFPYAQIEVVQFPDDLGGDKIIEQTFKGPLHHQLREALQYIQNAIIQEQIIKLPDVAEARRFFNYPFAAVEEALSNAVYHKLWKSFHNLCYDKLIVMRSQFRIPFEIRKFGTFTLHKIMYFTGSFSTS